MTRTKISDMKTRRSSRAASQSPKLEVIKGECPKCKHHELLQSMMLLKCAKCKHIIKRWF